MSDRVESGDPHDGETVEVCPNPKCGDTRIWKRRRCLQSAKDLDDCEYKCGRCQHTFDEPAVRERRYAGKLREDSLAYRLEQADASEVGSA